MPGNRTIDRRNGSPIETELLGPCESRRDACVATRERIAGVDYVTIRDAMTPSQNVGPVYVPKGYVYALGDHRDRSNDSRNFGPVPVNRVKGRALLIYWSANAARILKWLS